MLSFVFGSQEIHNAAVHSIVVDIDQMAVVKEDLNNGSREAEELTREYGFWIHPLSRVY